MARIKGITIRLFEPVNVGKDPFGHPIYEEKAVAVDNVLVSPVTSDDVVSTTNLYGKRAVYVLGIPKGDGHDWENRKVEFFGGTFRTFGKVIQGIDALIPLDWNKKVWVECYA